MMARQMGAEENQAKKQVGAAEHQRKRAEKKEIPLEKKEKDEKTCWLIYFGPLRKIIL